MFSYDFKRPQFQFYQCPTCKIVQFLILELSKVWNHIIKSFLFACFHEVFKISFLFVFDLQIFQSYVPLNSKSLFAPINWQSWQHWVKDHDGRKGAADHVAWSSTLKEGHRCSSRRALRNIGTLESELYDLMLLWPPSTSKWWKSTVS